MRQDTDVVSHVPAADLTTPLDQHHSECRIARCRTQAVRHQTGVPRFENTQRQRLPGSSADCNGNIGCLLIALPQAARDDIEYRRLRIGERAQRRRQPDHRSGLAATNRLPSSPIAATTSRRPAFDIATYSPHRVDSSAAPGAANRSATDRTSASSGAHHRSDSHCGERCPPQAGVSTSSSACPLNIQFTDERVDNRAQVPVMFLGHPQLPLVGPAAAGMSATAANSSAHPNE